MHKEFNYDKFLHEALIRMLGLVSENMREQCCLI